MRLLGVILHMRIRYDVSNIFLYPRPQTTVSNHRGHGVEAQRFKHCQIDTYAFVAKRLYQNVLKNELCHAATSLERSIRKRLPNHVARLGGARQR